MSFKRGTLKFASGTVLSRLFGLIRESVVAGVFGANHVLDAFIVANRLPNMLREMLAEGALGSSFTKVFSEISEKDSERARKLLCDSLWLFTLLLIIICAMGILGAPWLVKAMMLGSYATEENSFFFQQTVKLTRIIFPFIGFMTIGAIAMGALHQRGQFFLSASSSIALNLGYIIGALFFSKWTSEYFPKSLSDWIAEPKVTGLAFGVLLGGAMQASMQIWGLWKPLLKGHFSFPKKFPWSEDLKKVLILMGPMVIASSSAQINVWVSTNFATSLAEGSVSWLTFSFRLLQLPVGVFAVAVGSASLPLLSKAVAKQKANSGAIKEVSEQLLSAIEFTLWLIIPCMCFFLINSFELIELFFHHGNFNHASTVETASALYYYSFSLIGYGLIKVLSSYYYASERTSYAMRVSLFGVVINFLANLCMIKELGHNGIALTSSIVLSINATWLLIGLRKDALVFPWKSIFRTSGIVLGAILFALCIQKVHREMVLNSFDFLYKKEQLRAIYLLLTNGILVSLIFAVFALWRLEIRPKKAWILLISKINRPKK